MKRHRNMRCKVLITQPLFKECIGPLHSKYDVKVLDFNESLDIIELDQYHGILSMLYHNFDSELLSKSKNLKVLSNYAVGVNNIDLNYCKKHNIHVGFTPDILTNATADLALTLLLSSSRRLFEAKSLITTNKWKGFQYNSLLGKDLYNKTLGIYGLGRIGFAFAKKCAALFNMKIIYHNRQKSNYEDELKATYVSFEELLENSDVISIHANANKDNKRAFQLDSLKKMKKDGILINTSRGSLVDLDDLNNVLNDNHLFAAGLDVFEHEPLSSAHPILHNKKVVYTPHIGSATFDTRKEMASLAVRNLIDGLEGNINSKTFMI